MKISTKLLLLVSVTGFVLQSCEKSSTDETGSTPSENTANTKFIITATPANTTGVADYILTADDLTKGSITTLGNGLEQDGTYRYYLTHKNKLFSFLYGQGNPGAVTSYGISDKGALYKTSNFQTETVQAFTAIKDDVLLIKIPRSGTESALFFKVNAEKSLIVGEAEHNIVKIAGNGERAHFTWATPVGDKVYAPYQSIRGLTGNVFGTAYPDSAWVAVFSYPELKLEKVIRDNRTSFIGAYFTEGLAVDELGDVYAFSPSSAVDEGIAKSTKPSAFTRIKKNTTEFDQSYFFNVQEISGGHHISSQTYIGEGKFLLHMYGDPGITTNNNTRKLAIANVYTKTFTWVKNVPEVINSSTTRYNIIADDKKSAYIGINTPDGNFIYSINAETATATKGLKVEGGTITAIQKLKY